MIDPEYQKYLKSAWWLAKREQYFATYGKYCRACLKSYGPIQIHHLDYNNPTNPPLTSLVALCTSCHHELTKEWRNRSRRFGMDLRQFTQYFINKKRTRRK